jgi:hypothetical protein
MKRLTMLLILVFAVATAIAQEKETAKPAKAKAKGKAKTELKQTGFQQIDVAQVPDAVKNSFNSKAAGVGNVRWEKHTAKGKADKSFTKYVAVYTVDGVRSRSRFREDGTAMSSSKYMGAQKLPENIRNSATSKNPGFELQGGEEVKTKKGETYYRVRMKKGSSKLTSLYDANGNEVVKDNAPDEAQEDEGDEGN